MPLPAVNRPTLRKLLFALLRTDPDMDAFCLDYFPSTKRRFTSAMDRESKVNLLLELEDNDTVLQRLREAYPKSLEHQLADLLAVSVQPIAVKLPPSAEGSVLRLGLAKARELSSMLRQVHQSVIADKSRLKDVRQEAMAEGNVEQSIEARNESVIEGVSQVTRKGKS